jgi:uncharacterized LabA/DUF88 family protein
MTDRVAVFIDYQNVYMTAYEQFGQGMRRSVAHIDPLKTAALLVNRRRFAGVLTAVRVYRGYPDPGREPLAAQANDRQAVAWTHAGVTVLRRPLRYPTRWPAVPPLEKGTDVSLAIDFVRLAIEHKYDVGIIFSRDTDLLPAAETVADLKLAGVEVASWRRTSPIQFAGTLLPWCHHLGEADYRAVHDPTDYTRQSP